MTAVLPRRLLAGAPGSAMLVLVGADSSRALEGDPVQGALGEIEGRREPVAGRHT